jgi:predicted MFS family arabinose efflux permease
MGDYLGRRKAMWFAMSWIIVGATLQTSAFSVPHMLVARFVTGMTSAFSKYARDLC